MAVHFSILLIFTGLTGIHTTGITTVGHVSVKVGDSISVPCLYHSDYKNHVKYLCKGKTRRNCRIVIKTDQTPSSGKFAISDDNIQRVFTVTINQLTSKDSHYWCFVEISGIRRDVGIDFQLYVTTEIPRLHVAHQEITGYNGYNLTINCYTSNSRIMKWCRLGGYCVTQPSVSINGMTVTINASNSSGFTVTMTGLTTKSSGWYWCDTEDFQMPVHITVTEKPITITPTPTTVTDGITVATRDGENSSVGNGQHSASVDLKSLIIPLSLLILIVIVALFVWFMLRHRQTKGESSATAVVDEEVTYCDVKHKRKTSGRTEEEATYSNVGYMKENSAPMSNAESDVYVICSSVVTRKKRDEAIDTAVTYSTLAQHRRNI